MADLDKFQELEKLAELLEKGVLTQTEFELQKAKILNKGQGNAILGRKVQPQIVEKTPSKPFSEQIAPFTNWIRQNRKIVGIGGGSILLLALVYVFFIQSNPESDGRKAAKAECSCKTENNEAEIAAYQTFLKEYDKLGIKTREDAQKKLAELVVEKGKEVRDCGEKARSKYNSLKEVYILNSEQLSKFESAYSAQQSVCTVEKEVEKKQLLSDIEAKVGGSVQMSQDEIISKIKEHYTTIYNGKYKREEIDSSDPQTGMAGVCIAHYYTDVNGNIVRIDLFDGNTNEEQYYFWEGNLFFVFTTWHLLEDSQEHRYYVDKGALIMCKEKFGENGQNNIVDCDGIAKTARITTDVLRRGEHLKQLYRSKNFTELCN